MGKHPLNKGFTLVEMCIVILSLSSLTLVCLPAFELSNTEWYLFPSRYFHEQSKSILESEENEVEMEDGDVIHFNNKGNVRSAKTIRIGNRKIVVELGGGRLVEKQ